MAWTDDLTILPEHHLWRRIPGWHFVWDSNRLIVRPSSGAFDNDPDGNPMSVHLAEVLRQHGLDERHVLAEHRGFAIARFAAGVARDCGQSIAPDPLPRDPAHALVVGHKPKSVRNRISRASEWQTEPPALHLGGGYLLFEDRTGYPRIRRPSGGTEPVTPGPPPEPGWLRTAQEWLDTPGNAALPLYPAVAHAVECWRLPDA